MPTTTSQEMLRRTYQEKSLFGLQQIAHEIERAYVDAINRCILTYNKLQTTTEIADQQRAKLKQSWRSTPSCSLSRSRCIRRKCHCSYADYLQYRSMSRAAEVIERQFIEQAKQPYALQATWRFVVTDIARRLLYDYEYQQLYATALELAGELSGEMAELARFESGWITLNKFTSSAIHMSIGQNPYHTVIVTTVREPLPHQRR